MGWFGYGIYDGDDTQCCQYDFLKNAKVISSYEDFIDLQTDDMILLNEDQKKILLKNFKGVLKHMPKIDKQFEYFEDYDAALEWQMLLGLFVDNKMEVPFVVFNNGVKATLYLMGDHAAEFDYPNKRRAKLKSFIKKAEKLVVKM